MVNTVATLAALLPSEAVTAEYLRLLGDQDVSLLGHPAIFYAGDAMGRGSLTFQIPQLGLDGYRELEQVAEGAQVAPRELDDNESSLTIAPWRKAYEFSDLARAVQLGHISPSILAQDAVKATANTLMRMITGTFGGFSNAIDQAGNPLTGLHLLSAKAALSGRSVPGPYVFVGSNSQIEDFHAWLAATAGGGIQWMPATQAQLEAYGEGFQGIWGGMWIFLSNRCTTANAGVDSVGAMFGRGAIGWGDSSFAPEADPNILDFGGAVAGDRGRVRFERSRTGLAGNTAYITHANLGVAEVQDEAGERVISLAT